MKFEGQRWADSLMTWNRLVRLGAPSGHSSIPSWVLALPLADYVFPWLGSAKQVRAALLHLYPFFWDRAVSREGTLCREIRSATNTAFVGKLGRVELALMIGSITDAATETPISPVLTFILLMARHRNVQLKAQREIDCAIGSERSPTWADRDSLSYVSKCISECLRW